MRIADQQCMVKGTGSPVVDAGKENGSDPHREELTGHEAAVVQGVVESLEMEQLKKRLGVQRK